MVRGLLVGSSLAGDFEEVYGAEDHDEGEPQAGQWDAIVTCFFIDTVSPFELRSISPRSITRARGGRLGQERHQLPPHNS